MSPDSECADAAALATAETLGKQIMILAPIRITSQP